MIKAGTANIKIMISDHTKNLVVSFLEMFEEEFGFYLEDFHQIEASEAGVIIEELKGDETIPAEDTYRGGRKKSY